MLKKLITCLNVFEANIIKGRLEDEGISCVILNENFAYLQPNFNAIQGNGPILMVTEEDYKRAKELIETNMEGDVDELNQ